MTKYQTKFERSLAGDEHSALLQPVTDKLRLKAREGEDNDLKDLAPAACTPREGLNEVSVKMLNSQSSETKDKQKAPIWYKDKQVSRLCLLFNFRI